MTEPAESKPAAPQTLADLIRQKLETAATPLKLADVVKGLPKPKKISAAAYQGEARAVLDEDIRVGRAFAHPSGKKDELRYWSRDEKQAIRDEAVCERPDPMSVAALAKETGKVVKAEAGFAESVVRELIAEERLFEHPPKTKAAGPRFGPIKPPPPPPPLEIGKNKTAMDKLAATAKKLIEAAKVSVDDLLHALQARLGSKPIASHSSGHPPATGGVAESAEGAEAFILTAVANLAPGSVLSIPELRRSAPERDCGHAFDVAVLRLARAEKIAIFRHNQPGGLTDDERAQLVSDGHNNFFTGLSGRE